MPVNKVSELPRSQKIVIKLRNTEGVTQRRVEAPLPDGYGLSTGSAFTDPSNTDLAGGGGTASKVVKQVAKRSGFSTKISQKTNVFYDGPEPTEISFDMNFHSYYSAFHEVMVPVFRLMMMSVGRERSFQDIDDSLKDEMKAQAGEEFEEDTGKFGFIRSPGEAKVTFGSSLQIPRCYVASVGTEFSNISDNQGYPISANCSVSIKVARNPTQTELADYFYANSPTNL